MTSKYRESDKKAVGSYAFESLSRYFDKVIILLSAASSRTHLITRVILILHGFQWANMSQYMEVNQWIDSKTRWFTKQTLNCLAVAYSHQANVNVTYLQATAFPRTAHR